MAVAALGGVAVEQRAVVPWLRSRRACDITWRDGRAVLTRRGRLLADGVAIALTGA